MANVGYARVSTGDQSLDLQTDALHQAGCIRIFTDHGQSGKRTDRPELNAALNFIREGDVLVVWKLDRLGRSLKHLIEVVNDLEARKVGFRSIQEAMDTTTPAGKMIFHIFASLAEFEHAMIVERTRAGLTAAAARGRKGGRPTVMDPDKLAAARARRGRGESPTQIAKALGVSRASVYRHLAIQEAS